MRALERSGSGGSGRVMTVLGPISSEDMGVVLMHEHAAFAFPGWYADESVAPYERKRVEERWLKVLGEIKAVGVKTVVDATPADVGGRDPILLRDAAERSGVNTIMATGIAWEGDGAPRYFKFNQARGRNIEEDLYELFVREITVGVRGTGVRAGIIKLGSGDPKVSDHEKIVFRAGVRASLATGVPIITHCQGPSVGPEQMDLFLSLEANAKMILVGHQNNSTDLDYFLDQIKRPGFYLGFDRVSLVNPEAEDCIIELVKQGHADRLILSHDYVATFVGRPIAVEEFFPVWHPTYVHLKLIPKMKAAGITDSQIRTMLVDNPRSLFQGA